MSKPVPCVQRIFKTEHTHKYFSPGVGVWRDYTLDFRFLSTDNDAIVRTTARSSRRELMLASQGAVFRVVDNMNYYDFSWSADTFVGPWRFLRKKVGGNYTMLHAVSSAVCAPLAFGETRVAGLGRSLHYQRVVFRSH